MSLKNKRAYYRSGLVKCPICSTQTKLVEHHIEGRLKYYSFKPHNIVWICPNCHDLVHSNSLIIRGWLRSINGEKILDYTVL